MKIIISCLCFISVCTLYCQEIIVSPYLQPGNAPKLSKEEKVLIWQTDSIPGTYTVEYLNGKFEEGVKKSIAKISSVKLSFNNKTTILYRARLASLKFDESYAYRVLLNGQPIAQNQFASRSKKASTRFAIFGDCGQGTTQQAEVAYQVYQQKPEFVLLTGDIVYGRGLENEYRKNFFPYYNAVEADVLKGAPLMATVPFYTVIGNHDIYGSDFDKTPGGLAYFYYSDLPLNAPIPALTLETKGNPQLVKSFRKNAGRRFPTITNYSFDYGNVHIACLDANLYVNPLDPALTAWLAEDMKNSRADWKIVAYHHPGFNSSKVHYNDQQMRLLAPLLERLGVDLVLSGPVHNYQRSVPLKFLPKRDATGTQYVISKEGLVDGVFTLDQQFDGLTRTKPSGIIYIVTGSGGAQLYDREITNNPSLWKQGTPENWAPFTVKLISDTHSFTVIETRGAVLNLKQLDAKGVVLDEINVSK
jgi:predicted MPP superfamily phosphohydrolase